jgi:hypothetical protein
MPQVVATTSPVIVQYPMVTTVLIADNSMAHLSVLVEVRNLLNTPYKGQVVIRISGINNEMSFDSNSYLGISDQIVTSVQVPALSTAVITFDNNTFKMLNVRDPELVLFVFFHMPCCFF